MIRCIYKSFRYNFELVWDISYNYCLGKIDLTIYISVVLLHIFFFICVCVYTSHTIHDKGNGVSTVTTSHRNGITWEKFRIFLIAY